ncbi:hypothetical protein WKW79_19635 [Variovorax robiniae]|uniref:Outer membrane protein beta-barrel domain-containing protein n=1 Tax=Variovorax robiniae TaxID=1836199 RepID=A0ABU8XAE4_9BURK
MGSPKLKVDRTIHGAVLLAALVPAFADAQTAPADANPNAWRYSLSVYGYLPNFGGQVDSVTSPGGPGFQANVGQFSDSQKFGFMGSFSAGKGNWGAFSDYLNLNLASAKPYSPDFSLGGGAISSSTATDFSLKGSVWTLGGEYRVMSDPVLTLDLLAGARMFAMKPTLRWNVLGDSGSLQPVSRVGGSAGTDTQWDGIFGLKGRYVVGNNGRWSLPFYFDAGTGQSHLTYQAAAGVSYSYSSIELTAMWRYLSYDMKSGGPIDNLHFNGPMVGATVRW